MGRLTAAGAQAMLVGLRGTGLWLSLHSADPTAANELTGTDFPRIELTAAELDASGQHLSLQTAQTPTAPTVDIGTATHVALWTAVTGGDMRWTDTISGALATAAAVLSGDAVDSVTVADGGGNFVTAPVVRFLGGGGSGATGNAQIGSGTVTGVTVTNGGSGYTTAPDVVFDGGNDINVAISAGTQVSIPTLGVRISLPLS